MTVAMASGSLAAYLGLKPANNLLAIHSIAIFCNCGDPKATSQTAVEDGSSNETDTVPTPKVIIDQDSDPDATIVEITFGDRLGALLDTCSSIIRSLGSQLALGATFGVEQPKQIDVDIATHIDIYDDGPDRSLLVVETADRPGLLVDLVKIITDINITVQSGEFDTEGLLAKAKFHVSYRDKAIIKPLQQVLANSLRYFLRRPTTEEASF
ncbi:ACT domain-containing protein DS12, chloroplastic-like [Phoenix dactylifera]|uniref:ACT domain-containing protein ACR n=1 Tax=Phoenix dactylifera TaxID=42345 RepID=A0A8B9A8D2_PHODC|nr:ACT domain-containing protein DS12, chloroplastic-like [Phoenix dactylifera]